MALPVTGPIVVTLVTKGPPTPLGYKPDWCYTYRERYKQKAPIDRPLPYNIWDKRVLSFTCGSTNLNRYVEYGRVNHTDMTQLNIWSYNQAYERFKGRLSEAAELAVSLAERKQVMGMMNARILQLLSFGKYMLSGKWLKAGKSLGMGLKAVRGVIRRIRAKGIRKNAKASASAYLEFHFGWAPLVNDISNAVGVLTSPVPKIRVKARATVRGKDFWSQTPGPNWRLEERFGNVSSSQLAADVAVSNPNLWLANSLGLINPLKVAFELIPFSFVLDWFVNLSNILGKFTDFMGLTLSGCQWVTKTSCFYHSIEFDGHEFRGQTRTFSRSIGTFPGPTLTIRKPWQLSPRRGAAAAALLVQQLKSFH